MAETVRRIEYCYVKVPDEPGTAARTLAALKEAAGKTGLKLSDAKKAFLIQGDDRVGAVFETVGKLAKAKINITATMATAAGGGRYGMILWVAPADYEQAAKALGV